MLNFRRIYLCQLLIDPVVFKKSFENFGMEGVNLGINYCNVLSLIRIIFYFIWTKNKHNYMRHFDVKLILEHSSCSFSLSIHFTTDK